MADRVKVIEGLERCKLFNKVNCDKCPYDYNGRGNGKSECTAELATDVLALLKEQKAQKFFVDESGKITPLPVVVRCKECIHRGKAEKCVLAAISEEKDCPLSMLDNRGEWFCADGKKAATKRW